MQRQDNLVRRYVACYLFYLVLLILSAIAFLVWRQTILLLIGVAVGPNQADEVLFATAQVLIVFALFALVLLAEPYLRAGVPRGKLRSRSTRLLIAMGSVLIVGMILQEFLRFLPLGEAG